MAQTQINLCIEKVMGEWFFNITVLLFLLLLITLAPFALMLGWIDKEFGLQMFFLLLGTQIGWWTNHEK